MVTVRPEERRNIIMEKLMINKKVEISELEQLLNVSAMTIRRDLAQLEEQDKIIRTHGGAILKSPLVLESSFDTKLKRNIEQKQQIAQTAKKLIKNNSTILLDSGTTTLEIAKLLHQFENITVITNDIKIASELMDTGVKVIVTGGELQNNVGALFGPVTEKLIKNIRVDILFLGAHAVHLNYGVMAPTIEKANVKKLMIEASNSTWLVTDSSKFGQKSFMKVCDIKQLHGIITDNDIPRDIEKELQQQVQILKPNRAEEWFYVNG